MNFLTRWKIQLDSYDKRMNMVALLEMVEMFNKISEEDRDALYLFLINSDICHFLSRIMSYHERHTMLLLNKIISHFSETDEFFKNDFYRILKGYIRVLNSFPPAVTSKPERQTYHHNIFTCVTTLVKR